MSQGTEIKSIVQLTDKATDELKVYLQKQGKPNAALRIFVTAGGCSGLSYGMVVDEKYSDDDYVIDFGGAKVVVDRSSAPFIAGSTVDYRSRVARALTTLPPRLDGSPGTAGFIPLTDSSWTAQRCSSRSRNSLSVQFPAIVFSRNHLVISHDPSADRLS